MGISGRIARTLAAAVLAMGGAASPAASAEGEVSSSAKEITGTVSDIINFVQLTSMMAPVIDRSNGKTMGSAVVTAVFETGRSDEVVQICRNSPRLLDAMVQAFYDKPIDIDAQRRLNFTGLDANIKERVNHALGKDLVSKVYLFSGSKPVDGGVLDKLPFTSVLGCKGTNEENKRENGGGGGKPKSRGGNSHGAAAH